LLVEERRRIDESDEDFENNIYSSNVFTPM
jgi:hypothetical protein